MQKSERVLFIIGWIGIGLCIIAGLFIHMRLLDFIHGVELCYFHRVTGLYCPGCGMTRAVFALVSGHPLESLMKNIGLLGFGGIYAVFMCYGIGIRIRYQRLRKGAQSTEGGEAQISLQNKSRLFYKRLEIALYVVCALFILQWIVKNLLLMVWGIDLLAK